MKVAQDFLNTHDFVIVDIETTGLNCKTDDVTEIPLCFSISIQSDTAWRSDFLPFTAPA